MARINWDVCVSACEFFRAGTWYNAFGKGVLLFFGCTLIC